MSAIKDRIVALVAMILGGGLALPGMAFAADSATQSGVWQEHTYDFNYMGFTSIYSCDGLTDKLRLLLRLAGAREGAQVSASGCDKGFGEPTRFARGKLTFSTLMPALVASGSSTPGGLGSASAAASTPGIRGTWRAVTLAPNRPHELQAGDCELVEQFRDNVLPLFAIRGKQDSTHCVPHQSSVGFSLQFEVFAPADGQPRTAVHDNS